MVPKPKFSEGEKVLCFHGPLIYEAKCLKSSVVKEKHVRYFIHYAGWNKNWDEWVPESRVLKYNDANVQRQREVQRVHSTQPAKTKKTQPKGRKSENPNSSTPVRDDSRASSPHSFKDPKEDIPLSSLKKMKLEKQEDSGSDQPKKKRRFDLFLETEELMFAKVEVKIKIPEELKVWLVDDWDVISRQQKLLTLPAKYTVHQIMDNYIDFKKSSNSEYKESLLTDFTKGIKDYFNTTLGTQLLYRFERPQYASILATHKGKPMSLIYGAVHLLRLFSKIGPMLSYMNMSERQLTTLQLQVNDFLEYMVANRASLFNLHDYHNTSLEYLRKLN